MKITSVTGLTLKRFNKVQSSSKVLQSHLADLFGSWGGDACAPRALSLPTGPGPSTVLCGTPDVTSTEFEHTPLARLFALYDDNI